jgi:hypothetical protein
MLQILPCGSADGLGAAVDGVPTVEVCVLFAV